MSANAPSLPDPMTPADCDLRGMEWMPLYGGRLFGSDFDAHATDAEWRAALQLWWAAWNQVPAASLPDDDVALCRLAGFGRDVKAWRKVKERALYGFAKCSDGRLYHKALVGFANESWQRRLKDRERKARFRAERERREATGGTRTERGRDTEPIGDGTADEMRCDATRRDATLVGERGAPDGATQTNGAKHGTRLPADWQPSTDERGFASDHGLDPDSTADTFRDYWHAQPGARGRKTDWAATWRNWCRRDSKPQNRAGSRPVRSAGGNDALYQRLAGIAARGGG